MADKKDKRDKKKDKSKNSGKNKGSAAIWVVLGIVALLAGGIAVTWIYNPMGLRDTLTENVVRQIPIVNNLLSAPDPLEGYEAMSQEELIDEINYLQNIIDERDAQIAGMNNRIELYLQDIARLQEFEDQHVRFREDKAVFDQMIAENDPQAFVRFYESISPENAADLYPEASATARYDAEMKKYIRDFQAIDEKRAAAILEELVLTDMNLVVLILDNLNSEQSGAILGEMEPENASAVSRIRAPRLQG